MHSLLGGLELPLAILGAACIAGIFGWALCRAGRDEDLDRYELTPLAAAAASDPLGLWYELGADPDLEDRGDDPDIDIELDTPAPIEGGLVW
jgi:hypothetical protein